MLGVRAGIILPTGRPSSYMGEDDLRFNGGVARGPQHREQSSRLATDLGVMTRPNCENCDLVTPPRTSRPQPARSRGATRLRLYLPRATRTSHQRADPRPRWRAGLPLVAAPRTPSRRWRDSTSTRASRTTIGIAAGRGLTEGYGTTDLPHRSGTCVVELAPPEDPPPVYTVRGSRRPPTRSSPAEIPIVEPEFTDEVIAVKHQEKEIRIRDMLEFYVDTNKLKPESLPTLQAVGVQADQRLPRRSGT